jgi:hypothetical protein
MNLMNHQTLSAVKHQIENIFSLVGYMISVIITQGGRCGTQASTDNTQPSFVP